MNIDIERLKHDREYWDKRDPTGGEATHYGPECSTWIESWYKYDDDKWSVLGADVDPVVAGHEGNTRSLIPRPAKQWSGECLPPVGVECEVLARSHKWGKALVIAHVNVETAAGPDIGIVHQLVNDPHVVDWVIPSACRPLKSEKDRVVEAAMKIGGLRARDGAKEVYAVLYDAGFLKMPEGE